MFCRYYLLVGEEMKENLKEKVDFMNHNLYLFFWAPNNPEVQFHLCLIEFLEFFAWLIVYTSIEFFLVFILKYKVI